MPPFYQSGKHPHPLKSLSMSDGSVSVSPDFPFRKDSFPRRFGGSPQSRPISPGLVTSAASAKSYMDYRSATWDGSTPSSATDSEPPPPQQRRFGSSQEVLRHQRSRRSGSGPMLSNVDESVADCFPQNHASAVNTLNTLNTGIDYASRPKRGSYDQSALAEPDSGGISGSVFDLPMEETGASALALRQLHLEDRPPQPSSLDSLPSSSFYFSPTFNSHSSVSDSRLGMKRRASSPPPEAPHDEKAPSLLVGNNISSEVYQRNTTSSTAHLSANRSSPQNRFVPTHGSVSSASSTSLRNGSYASSNGLSVGSSITSISSYDRLSPGGISPSSEHHHSVRDLPYVTSLPLNSSPQDPLSRSQPRPPPDSKSAAAAIARKMSGQPSTLPKHSGAPKIQAHVHICECCPKKPKKFDTLQELK